MHEVVNEYQWFRKRILGRSISFGIRQDVRDASILLYSKYKLVLLL